MATIERDEYDTIAYESHPLPQAHPRRLQMLATLFGMQPAPVEECRYLELGCGEGGHLIASAFGLPGSRFVGVDRAEQPILRGRARAERLGLANATLVCADLMEARIEGGPFDYIVAHGLYSWVPPHVRERLLEICQTQLAPQGVAYISYNAFPGCHIRRMLWEMMRFHVRHLEEPRQKIAQAVELLKFLSKGNPEEDELGKFYQKELESAVEREMEQIIYHDDLASVNDPVYFHEFVGQASRHGLQYLAEADFFEMQHFRFPPEVRETLVRMEAEDLILKEQYLDFLKCRRFRQTLLCHQDVALKRQIAPSEARQYRFLSPALPTSATPNLARGAVEEFTGPRGGKMRIDHPLSKAALLVLGEQMPWTLPYSELVQLARQRLESDPGAREELSETDRQRDEEILCEVLLAGYRGDLLRWELDTPTWVPSVSERPMVNGLTRLELQNGVENVVTLSHAWMRIEQPFDRQVLLYADGTRTVDEIVREMESAVDSGRVAAPLKAAEPNAEPADVRTAVEQILASAAKYALLAA